LDEDCDSVAGEIAGRIGDWDRIPFLVAAGEMAEAQSILFTSFANDGPPRDSHFRIAEYPGLSMDPAHYR
jgi:hypothetical protein